jgi:hypothetical protein
MRTNIYHPGLVIPWKSALTKSAFRKEFLISVVLLASALSFLTKFLVFIEARRGVSLPDPVLALFDPVDVTLLIFLVIYISLFASIVFLIRSPYRLLMGIQLYALMVIVRMLCMYFVPLEPPVTHLPLQDPFVEFFGTGTMLTKDLFFSGHTATLFILFLIADKGFFKYFLLGGLLLVVLLVILQHVHYTIDVVAAFFVTYGCYSFVRYLQKKKILVGTDAN